MQVLSTALLVLLFLPNLVFVALLPMLSRSRGAPSELLERRLAMGASLLSAGVALFSTIYFYKEAKVEFLWSLTIQPNPFFDFSLHLQWTRFIWIFFSALCVSGILFASPLGKQLSRQANRLRYIYLSAVFLFVSLAYLSESEILSVMFIEVIVFLLYSNGMLEGGRQAELERVSYFKRAIFIFLGLILLLPLAALGVFPADSIMMLSIMLYAMSLIYSRHNFLHWGEPFTSLLQSGAAFFLVSLVLHQDLSIDLWSPLAAIFAALALLFSLLSFISLSSLNGMFWLSFAWVSTLFSLRFFSGYPYSSVWPGQEVVSLLGFLSIGTVMASMEKKISGAFRNISLVMVFLLMLLLFGGLPGYQHTALEHRDHGMAISLIMYGAPTFVFSLVLGKMFFIERQRGGDEHTDLVALSIGACVAVIILYFGLMFFFAKNSLSPTFSGYRGLWAEQDIQILVGITALLSLAAFSIGAVIGHSRKFTDWIKGRDNKLKEVFPRVDPVVMRTNDRLVSGSEVVFGGAISGASFLFRKIAVWLEKRDAILFGSGLSTGVHKYVSSISLFLRYFHSGNIRAYFFTGILVLLLASILFLTGGKL